MSPSAPKDEDLADLSPYARLVFHYMPLIADCKGRLVDRPKLIKAELLPYDDVDIEEILEELARERTVSGGSFILRYEAGGRCYIQILQFGRYQNPHPNEKKSYEKSVEAGRAIPPPPNNLEEDVAETLPVTSSQHTTRARSLDHGLIGSLDHGVTGDAPARVPEPAETVSADDPETVATAVISEINRWLPDQSLKLHAGLLKPIANLLLCGDPGGVTKIRGAPTLFTLADLIDLAHGYIVAEATDEWNIGQRAQGKPYAFARVVRDAGRVAEYAERGRKVWDSWRAAEDAGAEKAKAVEGRPEFSPAAVRWDDDEDALRIEPDYAAWLADTYSGIPRTYLAEALVIFSGRLHDDRDRLRQLVRRGELRNWLESRFREKYAEDAEEADLAKVKESV